MEKPFASLVDNAETTNDVPTTDGVPRETPVRETNSTAYLHFKEEGLQEEADWDRTLLDDGDEEDSDDEDADGDLDVVGGHMGGGRRCRPRPFGWSPWIYIIHNPPGNGPGMSAWPCDQKS